MTAPGWLALLLLAVVAAPLAAQNGCVLIYQEGEWTAMGPPDQRVINASGPLLVRCPAGEELRADSAVVYEVMDEVHLFGRVDYQDPTRSLTSDYATYNGGTGRLWATGNVVFTDRNRGSTLRGPNLEYFRAVDGRPETQAIATERPHLTVAPRGGRGREPMEVDADRITTVGEDHVTAEGNVVVEGSQMDAWAQEAYYDDELERIELRRDARVQGERYELTADFIESDLAEGAIERVLARGNSRLVEERMRVTGPQLQLFFARDSLQRLVSGQAQADSERSVAFARGFRMEADSLEALTPGQRVRQVTAIGRAAGESWDTLAVRGPNPGDATAPDTVAGLPLGEKDLIFADTIIGWFRPDSLAADSAATDSVPRDTLTALPRDTAAADTARQRDAELERMLAFGDARSLYRLRPGRDDPPEQRRGINYVIADTIDLTFTDGEVDIATVRGLKRGLYLDPEDPDSARADSLRADSVAVDTGRVVAPPAPPPTAQPVPPAPAPAPPPAPPPPPAAAAPPERRQRGGVR